MTPPVAYFTRIDERRFHPSSAVQGAWNTSEQHIAPALGLLAHVIDQHVTGSRAGGFHLGRISYDILGVLPLDTVTVETRVLRPGKTVELVEGTLSHDGRSAASARAWYLRPSDTDALSGSYAVGLPSPTEFAPWSTSTVWPGEFVTTLDVRRKQETPGRAQYWIRPHLPLVAGENSSPATRLLSVLDVANGITPRVDPDEIAFPNVDLSVHLFSAPRTDWLGFDTAVSFGAHGIGLTQSVLHDEHGPIGTAQQTLALRPRR